MGEHDEDQEHGAEPARPPLTAARAREMTTGLRDAMDDVRRSVAVLAARVRDAHAARVWLPLGHSSWESYCAAEFGISRAQAYRLLDVARSLAAIHGAVAAHADPSRMVRQAVRDVRTAPPPPPAEPPPDPAVAALRRAVDHLAASSHAIGELMLEVAPAYLSDIEAADVLALLCEQIGEPLEHGLAARRYAMSGDRRALHGTVL
ncbi:hypothetical protein [Streptomyces thermolilacinus]|uniref:hypothetical protein n=1 Tax=Streptomyces thermolilacinus TaxID=285540 RepID=UPI0033F76C26